MTCPNEGCGHHNRESGKHIIMKGRNRAGHQRYFCFRCATYFVETSGTPMYRKHMSASELTVICRLLAERRGIRSIERSTGRHRDTIGRLLGDMAEHAERLDCFLARDMNMGRRECESLWTTVRRCKRVLSAKAMTGLKNVVRGHGCI